MIIPTEPIGSIPRPLELLAAIAETDGMDAVLDPLYEAATRVTIRRFEETGSPVITDGEHRKFQNFWTYAAHGMANTEGTFRSSSWTRLTTAACRLFVTIGQPAATLRSQRSTPPCAGRRSHLP
jgi:methionine synthase II (cobalamin-independent)